jgi:hypothetical protein
MSTQILPEGCTFAMRRSTLAAIGISLFALSATTLGADLRTADPSAVAPAPADRHPTPARPSDPPAINDRNSAVFVDQLYQELMKWNPPPCLSARNDASLRGHC